MSTFGTNTEIRNIRDVRRVVLRDYGQLFITQGDHEELKIEGDPEVMSMVHVSTLDGELVLDIQGGWFDKAWKAFTSSMERKSLKYHLTVKELEGIWVSGAGRVKMNAFQGAKLKIMLQGAGEIILNGVEANEVDINIPGAGVVSVAGKTTVQHVKLNGAGSYDAPRLESDDCFVSLKGIGKASVWALKNLDATVDGIGTIEYFGNPNARKSVSGLGKINQRMH